MEGFVKFEDNSKWQGETLVVVFPFFACPPLNILDLVEVIEVTHKVIVNSVLQVIETIEGNDNVFL